MHNRQTTRSFACYMALVAVLYCARPEAAEKPVIFPQLGHSGLVKAAAFSPDGKYLLVAEGRRVKVWQVRGWQELRSLPLTGDVSAMDLSRDGRLLATGSDDGSVVLLDWKAGKSVKRFAVAGAQHVYAVDLAPDGRRIAAAGDFGWIVWDVGSGRVLAHPFAEAQAGRLDVPHAFAAPLALRFVDSGTVLFGDEHDLVLWDIDARKPLRAIAGHEAAITEITASADGKEFVSRDAAGGVVVNRLQEEPLYRGTAGQAALSRDGRRLYACALDGSLAVAHLEKRSALATKYRCPPGYLLEEPKRGRLVGVASTLTELEVASGKKQETPLSLALPAVAVAVPDAAGLFVAVGTQANVLRRWSLTTGRAAGSLGGPGTLARVAATPDGRTLAVLAQAPAAFNFSGVPSGIRIVHEGKVIALIPAWPLRDVAISADGRRVLGWIGRELKIWNADSGALLRQIAAGDYPAAVALSPDGDSVVTTGAAGERAWRTGDGALLWRRVGATDPGAALAFSAGGRTVFVGSASGGIVERDARSGKALRELKGHAAPVNALSLSRDGTLLASASWDGTLRAWDIASGRTRGSVKDLDGHAAQIAFSADGSRLLAAMEDGSTRMWRSGGGRELARFVSFTDGEWLAITPEGYFAASAHGPDRINVRMGGKLYALNRFYDAFYRPDLVLRKLRGEDVSAAGVSTLEDALRRPPPRVDFPAAARIGADGMANARYRVRSAGGGIGAIRVFHNGKLIHAEAKAEGDRSAFLDHVSFEPMPGENEIAVVAFNRSGTVQSEPVLQRFATPLRPVKPRLYLLAVGINDYVESPLQFSVKDAESFAAAFGGAAASLYGAENVIVRVLTDRAATRAGIISALSDIAGKAKPWDRFVLFVASHGVLYEGVYGMVAQDYDGELPHGVINAAELLELAKAIPAHAELLVLDTCHAGGLNSVAQGLYDARMGVLARSAGLHIFASAASTQEAIDGYGGHGLFTKALLDAMRDRETDRNGDGTVSIVELGAKTREGAIEAAAKIHYRQTPVIMSFGEDVGVFRAGETIPRGGGGS